MNNTLAYMFTVLKEPHDNIGNRKSVLWRDAMNLANSHLLIYLENTNDLQYRPRSSTKVSTDTVTSPSKQIQTNKPPQL